MVKNAGQNRPKVLVVDDERVIAETLAIILNRSGFSATAVYGGVPALDLAKSLEPDILISDVVMPDLNGIDLALRIRELLPSCRIVLFSGQAATAELLGRDRIRSEEFEILPKPIPPEELLSRLNCEIEAEFRTISPEQTVRSTAHIASPN